MKRSFDCWEGFGLALLEAQVTGLPALVSDNIPLEIPLVGRSRRILLNDIGTWLKTCEKLILEGRNSSQSAEMFENLKEFYFDTWVHKIEELYREGSISSQ